MYTKTYNVSDSGTNGFVDLTFRNKGGFVHDKLSIVDKSSTGSMIKKDFRLVDAGDIETIRLLFVEYNDDDWYPFSVSFVFFACVCVLEK